MPKFLPSMDVGKVNLNGRHSRCSYGVSQGDARMSVGSCIQNNHIELAPCLLNPGNYFAFEVGLTEINGNLQLSRPITHTSLNFCEARPPINFRLSLAEQIQVRAIQEEDFHREEAT